MFAALAISMVCLMAPVDGPVIAPFAPIGRYGGHWGVDFGAAMGDAVHAPASGRVTFAGSVAGMRSVTVEPVAGLKVSVSYLDSVEVRSGQWVERGERIGTSGAPHGVPGVHLSLRIAGEYVDPAPQLNCRRTDISRGLRLLPPAPAYPAFGAYWDSRRDFRSDSYRPPSRWRVGAGSGRPRSSAVHSGRRPLAEGVEEGAARFPPLRHGRTSR